jgi:hypothetical protein
MQAVQDGGEGGLQAPMECRRVLQVLRLLHGPELAVQTTWFLAGEGGLYLAPQTTTGGNPRRYVIVTSSAHVSAMLIVPQSPQTMYLSRRRRV